MISPRTSFVWTSTRWVGCNLLVLCVLAAGCGRTSAPQSSEVPADTRTAKISSPHGQPVCGAAREAVSLRSDIAGTDLQSLDSPGKLRELSSSLEAVADAIRTVQEHVDDRYHAMLEASNELFMAGARVYREADFTLEQVAEARTIGVRAALDDISQSLDTLQSTEFIALEDELDEELVRECGEDAAWSATDDPVPQLPVAGDTPSGPSPEAKITLPDDLVREVREHIRLARDRDLDDRPCPLWDAEALSKHLQPHFDDLTVAPAAGMGFALRPDSTEFSCALALQDRSQATWHVGMAVEASATTPVQGHPRGGQPIVVPGHGEATRKSSEAGHLLTLIDPSHDVQLTITTTTAAPDPVLSLALDAILTSPAEREGRPPKESPSVPK